MDRWRDIVDDAVAATRFSGAQLAAALIPVLLRHPSTRGPLGAVSRALSDRTAGHTTMGLIRSVFLIELVNEAITSTKFERRWVPRLADDPRGCTFDECTEIFIGLAEELAEAVADTAVRELLDRFRRFADLPYETPVDYRERATGHRAGNLLWLFGEREITETVLLRQLVCDPMHVGELTKGFRSARKKIRVKTYLTDRAQTGEFQTNREKRWEAHPGSVQFALRRDCLKVEHKLLSQICDFEGFPAVVRESLAAKRAIVSLELPARCPITRDALDFERLLASLEDPEWGRSAFQVGHLNPLKGPGEGPKFGHTPDNVAWITADGNRIQGHLSYADTMALLDRIRDNHARYGRAE